MKVLILDLTHGGEVLAESYVDKGDTVTAVDVYRNCPPLAKERMASAGIRITETTPSEMFDLAVSPIHCPDRFLQGAKVGRRITHHQAVGELARFDYPVIEVTGAVAKTSSCHILAHILRSRGKNVLLLTSSGLVSMGKEVDVLEEKVSIAPASILRLSRMKGDWDYGVFECSLGGTGLADIGIVTNTSEEYAIAAGTRSSTDGKVQMVRSAKQKIVIASEDEEILEGEIPGGVDLTTFGQGGDVQVKVLKGLELGKEAPAVLRVKDRNIPLMLSGRYLAPAYSTGLNAAAALAFAAGVDPKDIARSLSSFGGVPGRGEVEIREGKVVIRDRNPGVTARSMEWNIGILEEYYRVDDLAITVDPVNAKVCERLDLDELARTITQRTCVRAAYLIECGSGKAIPEPFVRISSAEEIPMCHAVLLMCTKEGYV